MKPKENSLMLIYDDSCPMCDLYTRSFVKTKWINKRCEFSEVNSTVLNLIDNSKCKNEIPLYNSETNTVIYGIDALFYILQQRFSFLTTIFRSAPVLYLFKRFYSFISYNRRLIAGSQPAKKGFDCTPDFNLKYRLLYLVFANAVGFAFYRSASAMPIAIAISTLLIALSFFHARQMDFLGHEFTVFMISGFVCFLFKYVPVQHVNTVLSIAVFSYLFLRRLKTIRLTYPEDGGFTIHARISKTLLSFFKYALRIHSKKYSEDTLPSWLNVAIADKEPIGKEFYKSHEQQTHSTVEATNSRGLCNLSSFNSNEFDASRVDRRIIDFYKNTHLYRFSVAQKWHTWYGFLFRYVIKHYFKKIQQFNFTNLTDKSEACIENYLTPMIGKDGAITINWVRHNEKTNDTMFSGFYKVDKLPYEKDKACVTTQFPLPGACFMVKLKPVNEENGSFSFQSYDTGFGDYSFYAIQKHKKTYYARTLPVLEKIHLSVKNERIIVEHQFFLLKTCFMSFVYHVM
jgi:predicted DCC family thiol-disulfide oxidoreductase YuxK